MTDRTCICPRQSGANRGLLCGKPVPSYMAPGLEFCKRDHGSAYVDFHVSRREISFNDGQRMKQTIADNFQAGFGEVRVRVFYRFSQLFSWRKYRSRRFLFKTCS